MCVILHKADTDVVVLTSAVWTITTMLPLIPAYVGPWLPELFDIFVRLSSFRAHSKGMNYLVMMLIFN